MWTYTIAAVVGLFQLAFGLAIGFRWARRRYGADSYYFDAAKSSKIAKTIQSLASQISGDVTDFSSQMRQATDSLTSASETADPKSTVMEVVDRILCVNERLQSRLSASEAQIKWQTEQIKIHLSDARTDVLTGLSNRRALEDELARRLAAWRRKPSDLCLIILDIDDFKQINDAYGHPVGDQVLVGLAERLRGNQREMDFVARYGGEEFAFILPDTDLRSGEVALERLREAIEHHGVQLEDGWLPLTVSLGLTALQAGDDRNSFVERADSALYAAKNAGRNQGFIHDGESCRPVGTTNSDALPNQDSSCATENTTSKENESCRSPVSPELDSACDELQDSFARLSETETSHD